MRNIVILFGVKIIYFFIQSPKYANIKSRVIELGDNSVGNNFLSEENSQGHKPKTAMIFNKAQIYSQRNKGSVLRALQQEYVMG